jgi:glycine cleavage system H protein
MNPKDLKYTVSHEWVRVAGDVATIGITEHAAHTLSDLVFLGLPGAGDTVSAGSSFGEIESVKAVSDLNSPVDGEVVEVNAPLTDELSTINADPYGAGWLIKVRVKGKLPGTLLDADAYEKLIAETA